jgi:membrane protein implicated in regulation of membrane protease activity
MNKRLWMLIGLLLLLVFGGAGLMVWATAALADWATLVQRLIVIGGVALVFLIWDELRQSRKNKKR